ncbi:aminomethyl transferase family protein [Candidatus Persebacteraceae bacterium Df01]|jgi:aminomethyltransferase|uniref:Aminomethyl transferase family protein n=1 Tax=Candidatus Doriopsillibacter californiensis TaxID=2970740 RepID=A0ABT7QLH9_9GAMM|nr:aminomethyl transferase family protein [Candidatus Persebacteraceae bacterium Df01]
MSIKKLSEAEATWPADQSLLKTRRVPIQLRQSGDSHATPGLEGISAEGSRMLIDQRIRKGPYWHLSQEAGCWCHSVYNRIYHPRAYIKPEDGGLMEEYKYLTEHVTMWNVAVERQIQVKGPDAEKFVDMVITRKASSCAVMKARYVILCNQYGGVLNDPVMLRLAEDEFWFSLSDSDLEFWLQGVNAFGQYDVEIHEIDVAPVQIQGPKSTPLMRKIFGAAIDDVAYYGLMRGEIGGCEVIISRSGFSAEAGYEIYLYDATKNAEKMWNSVLEAGKEFNLKVIAPGHHRRIEAGILSWGQDMDQEINPFEIGLDWQVDFGKDNFIGKAALQKIKDAGVTHKLCGVRMGGKDITWYPSDFYHVFDSDGKKLVGYITSAWYSPAQKSNIGFAFLPVKYTQLGTNLNVSLPEIYNPDNKPVEAEVVSTPFKKPYDPGTGLAETGKKL